MQKKAYLISFLVIALILGAWAVSPAQSAGTQFIPEARTTECRAGADVLVGNLAALPRVQNRIRNVCEFNVRMTRLDSRISQFDRQFIENAIAMNRLEVQALEFTLTQTQNEEWRSLIQMMIAMHAHDLEMAVATAERLGLNTNPDLTNVRVYPETPDYDLGMRRVDLVAKFLHPLMNVQGQIPTETPTAIPTIDLTGTPTTVPTIDLTGTPTAIPTEDLTGTPTAVPTNDLTGTPTTVPTDELTGTPTTTSTETLTETPTTVPTDTATETATAVPTLVFTYTPTMLPTVDLTGTATASPTAVVSPTPGDGTDVNFDLRAIHIIEEIHIMHLETALVAQRLVRNDEVRAFAKHAADAAKLHLILISDLKHRLFDGYTPPPPDFESEYQGPRRFFPDGE